MIKLNKNYFVLLLVLVFLTAPLQIFAAGVVSSGTTQIQDSGSSNSPALWWLNQDTVTPATERFVIGGYGKSHNHLTVDADYSFTASNGLLVGANYSYYNLLNIQAGGNVIVSGTLKVGEGSISRYSRYNEIKVS